MTKEQIIPSNTVYNKLLVDLIRLGIGIGIRNFVADISVIRISLKAHISATLLKLAVNIKLQSCVFACTSSS